MLKSFFQSSVNPNEISLTIKSGATAVVSVVVAFAAIKGIDAAPLVDGIKNLADQTVIMVTTAVGAYHAIQTIIGFLRKFTVVKPVDTTSTSVVG